MYRFEHVVPLIGPTVTGPLGVRHLPRMWLKSTLSAAGLLYEGYFDHYKGFNQRVVDGIGLAPDPWFAFLATQPTYPEAEAYVRAHATKLDAASIETVNTVIATVERDEQNAAPVRARIGIEGSTLRTSAVLVSLDDWYTIHQMLVAHRSEGFEPLVPMVSTAEMGLAGIVHVPRLWIKALLAAVGALPAEWKTCLNCGLDKAVAGTIGLDVAAAAAFINAELPNFPTFERWVLEQIGHPDDATKAAWNAQILAKQKNDEMAAADVAEAGEPDATLRGVVVLNDLVDWRHMRDFAVARTTASVRQ